MAIVRTNLYHLIDQLPDATISLAEKMLQAIVTEFPPFNEKEEAKEKLMRMIAMRLLMMSPLQRMNGILMI